MKVFKHLSLSVCDTPQAWHLEMSDQWWRHGIKEADEGAPVGFFTLIWDSGGYQAVHVRRRINELERAFPLVGSSVLDIIHRASYYGLECLTPEWGEYEIQDMWCDDDDDEEDDDSNSGSLSLGKFARLIPEIVRNTKYHADRVEQARQRASWDSRLKRFRKILDWTAELKDLCEEAGALNIEMDHTGSIETGSGENLWNRSVAVLTWCGNTCPMIHLADYHIQSLCDDGRIGDIAWAHGFQLGLSDKRLEKGDTRETRDGSLGAAIAALKIVIRMTVLVDKILDWLHHDNLKVRLVPQLGGPEPRAQKTAPRSNALIDLFPEEYGPVMLAEDAGVLIRL